MGYRREDGTWEDSCLAKVAANEPIFVLRAQDKFAPALVEAWAALAREHGVDPNKLQEAYNCAAEMRQWGRRKFPD